MPFSPNELTSLLCCPDDGAPLAARPGGLLCEQCHRLYPFLATNILDLLPSSPVVFPDTSETASYQEGYLSEFFRPSELRADAIAWGAPEARSRKWLRVRQRQVHEVFQFLRAEPCETNSVFCDLSAGAGHCTFRAAQEYAVVFHCDLSMDALTYASAKARASDLENIVFVRADYFQPPFRNSIDHLVCLDTLIRGPWHETKLLGSLQSALTLHGAAVVDFHNWWHNPLRRVGFLPDNFVGNKSYTRQEMAELLLRSGIRQIQTRPFVQEVDTGSGPGKFLARFIPPTRWMVRLGRASPSSPHAPSSKPHPNYERFEYREKCPAPGE